MSMTSRLPLVSVVMPVRDVEATIGVAINSVLEQSFTDFELLVCNDGSTDQTAGHLSRFQASDRRVRVLTLPGGGLVAALQAGLGAVRGSLIARMDGDDICHPERFAEQVALLHRDPETGLAGCLVEFAGDRERQSGYAIYVDWLNSLVDSEAIALNRFIESPLAHPSVMFRRSLIDRFGSYRSGPFPEDYELWLRWLDAGVKMVKCARPLLAWRDSPERLSRNDPRYHPRAFFDCKNQYLARWLQRNNPFHPDITVWGAGRETRRRIESITRYGVRIAAYIDIDPRKIGQIINCRPVLSATALPPPEAAFIVACVGSRGAREDIRRRLGENGYVEGDNFIVAG